MRSASGIRTAFCVLGVAGVVACNAITGASDLRIDDLDLDAGLDDRGVRAPSGDSSTTPPVDAAPPPPPVLPGFPFRRTITLTSDAPDATVDTPVLLALGADFPTEKIEAGGNDLRFRVAGGTTDLPYFLEAWGLVGGRRLWVLVPKPRTGTSAVYMFYGNASAPAQSSFAATFPRALKSMGALNPTADIDVDWFELAADDTLTLPANKPFRIHAQRIIIAGRIEGSGRGHPGGVVPAGIGTGPGGGQISASNGSGGGGYGGAGGAGGTDLAGGSGGLGGIVSGTANGDELAMGSGGGATTSRPGGAGGGAITIDGHWLTISSSVTMNGQNGEGGPSGQCSGGGSGGGILVGGSILELAKAKLEASGGNGGTPTGDAADGGGGGGGGRVKIRQRPGGSTIPGELNADNGAGGVRAGSASGRPGVRGTVDSTASPFAKTIEASIGPEEKP